MHLLILLPAMACFAAVSALDKSLNGAASHDHRPVPWAVQPDRAGLRLAIDQRFFDFPPDSSSPQWLSGPVEKTICPLDERFRSWSGFSKDGGPRLFRTLLESTEKMSLTQLIPLFAVALATLAASVTDLWKFKVYNVLTLPTLLLGLVVSTLLGGWSGLGSSLLGAILGFGLLVVFYAVGGVGAGDVKLLAAVGAWLGPYLTYQVFIASALFGGIYALILVLGQRGILGMVFEIVHTRQTLLNPSKWKLPSSTIEGEVQRADRRRRLVPYAAMTCLGYLATIAWWGSDLQRVWPPTERSAAVTTVSSTNDI